MANSRSLSAPSVLIFFPIIFLLYIQTVTALQVTPNSPCSQFCLDDADLDRSDPRSSNTKSDDIVCKDADFTKKAQGQKFQRCLACLQDSTFERGKENDQDWFLYNLKYSFSYCVFGYPNATGIGSSPCITSEACGALESAITKDIADPDDRTQYDYCKVDENAMLSNAYEKCHACLKADRTQFFVSNFLVALEAGCLQQPPVGTIVGLNDTVFSTTTVQIVDPNTPDTTQSTTTLSNAAIAGIAIGALVFLLAAISCTYMQWRKRRNRLNRANPFRTSSLSFRCQAHLTPREPGFRNVTDDDLGQPRDEKSYPQETVSLELGPFDIDSKSPWNPRNAPKLSSLTTSLPSPPLAHTDLKSASDDVSPASTVSVRSNAPLLFHSPNSVGRSQTPPPASGIVSPLFSPGFTVTTPRTPRTGFSRENGDSNNPWMQQSTSGTGRDLMKKNSWGTVAPVEIRNVQIKFDPPPKKARK